MKNRLFVNILIPAAALLLVFSAIISRQSAENYTIPENQLQLHFLDVGQGDCILAVLPNGKTMLIDAGGGDSAESTIKYIKNYKISKIDLLIATHPHEDHIGGMDEVISNFDIGEVYMPKVTTNTRAFENLLLAIKQKNLKVSTARSGVILFEENGFKAEFLAPINQDYEELNNYSAVTKITFGQTSFLLCGDAEDISENEMLKNNADLKAGVIKIAHHGSNSSSIKGFLRAVSPKEAVISVGKDNSYNHPSKKTLQRIIEEGAVIYRTDEMGTIVITSDGSDIKVGY